MTRSALGIHVSGLVLQWMQAAPVTLELKFDVHVCGCAGCSFGKGHVHFTEINRTRI